MMNFKTALKWFFALTKRLLNKKIFVLALLLIPVFTYTFVNISQEKSGIITVAVCAKDSEDFVYQNILTDLLKNDSVLLFYQVDSIDTAVDDVKSKKADCAWVFEDNLDERIKEYVQNKRMSLIFNDDNTKPLSNVYLREDSILYKFSREKLYSSLYTHISDDIFIKYVSDKIEPVDEEKRLYLEQLYCDIRTSLNDDFIEFEFVDNLNESTENLNYITAPLRGILAVILTLCCLASVMFSIEDERAGKYSLFPISKRLMLHLTNALSATVLVSVVVLLSLFLSNNSITWIREILLMLLFALVNVGFCTLLGVLFKRNDVLCMLLPVLAVAMLTLSPVFLNMVHIPVIQRLLPPYLYLNAIYDNRYIFYMLVYIVLVYPLNFLAYKALNRE